MQCHQETPQGGHDERTIRVFPLSCVVILTTVNFNGGVPESRVGIVQQENVRLTHFELCFQLVQ